MKNNETTFSTSKQLQICLSTNARCLTDLLTLTKLDNAEEDCYHAVNVGGLGGKLIKNQRTKENIFYFNTHKTLRV